MLYHLLSNALKFTPAGGTVTVELKKSGETLRLTVSDTGCGIPPERMAHLFDGCFQPGHPSPAPYGLGLGLPLCRAIAEKHGGSITVESAPGKGSRFMVTLPAVSYTHLDVYKRQRWCSPAMCGTTCAMRG